jgi:hypothetical protein
MSGFVFKPQTVQPEELQRQYILQVHVGDGTVKETGDQFDIGLSGTSFIVTVRGVRVFIPVLSVIQQVVTEVINQSSPLSPEEVRP